MDTYTYNLDTHAKDGWVYIEMRRAVWGLPQAGILANKRLRRKLAPFGYYKCVNTPGLWRHDSRPLTFTLVTILVLNLSTKMMWTT